MQQALKKERPSLMTARVSIPFVTSRLVQVLSCDTRSFRLGRVGGGVEETTSLGLCSLCASKMNFFLFSLVCCFHLPGN